jgi:hypothetical protein
MEELLSRIDALEARFAEIEPGVQAFLPEPNRFARLRREALEAIGRREGDFCVYGFQDFRARKCVLGNRDGSGWRVGR